MTESSENATSYLQLGTAKSPFDECHIGVSHYFFLYTNEWKDHYIMHSILNALIL